MRESTPRITRRQTLKTLGTGLAGTSTLALLPACAAKPVPASASAAPSTALAGLAPDAALERVAYAMLAHEPGRATGLGVDTGEYAAWRSTFGTGGAEGRAAYAATLKELVAEVRAYPKDGLTSDQQIGFEVVETAFASAVEGMAKPYGDVAVGSWRNAPYVVIQNVGGYIDLPRHFGSGQPLNTADDIGPYMSRLAEVPALMDGELDRIRDARGQGVVPPDFLLEKAIRQMEAAIASAGESYAGPLSASKVAGSEKAAEQAGRIAAAGIVPALERQLAELKVQRAEARDKAGMWAQPGGEDYYGWALRASTTTRLSPDEIHQQGLDELKTLHGRMDPILREIGYTQGSVGEYPRQRRRADARAERRSALPVCRRGHGPRGDLRLHQRTARLDPVADAARLQPAGRSQNGGPPPATGRRARRARRLWRRGQQGRQHPRAVLDQPQNHRPPPQI